MAIASRNIQLAHHHHQGIGQPLPICLLANDLDDPRNIGSLYRLADAFALEKIYLTGRSPQPPHPKIRKTSRHTDRRIETQYQRDAMTVIDELKARNTQILCLELTTQSTPLQQLALAPRQAVCLVVGAENSGVNQALLDTADLTVHIPMLGNNSSMNVVTASAIALYEISNRLTQPNGEQP